MSNSAIVRALRRRINFYLNSPVFNKYGRSLKDFLIVTGLTILTFLPLIIAMLWAFDDGGMAGIGVAAQPIVSTNE